MVKSVQHHFRVENNQLKIDADFIPKDDPGILIHCKLIGFILWLIGKAKHFEGKTIEGKKCSCFVSAKRYNLWKAKLNASVNGEFKDLDSLLNAVKKQVEKLKLAKLLGPAAADINKQPIKVEKKIEPQQKLNVIEEGKKIGLKKNPDVVENNLLPCEQRLVWNESIENNEKIANMPSLKEIVLDFSNLKKEDLLRLKEIKKVNIELVFTFTEPTFLSNCFNELLENEKSVEILQELFIDKPASFINMLHQLLQIKEKMLGVDEKDKLDELYTKLLNHFTLKENLSLDRFESLSSEDKKTLFTCLLANVNDPMNNLNKFVELCKDKPVHLIELFKLLKEDGCVFKDKESLSTIIIKTLIQDDKYNLKTLNALSENEKKSFADIVSSQFFYQTFSHKKNRIFQNPQEINAFYQTTLHFFFDKEHLPDQGALFLFEFRQEIELGDNLLSLSEEQLLFVESSFKNTKQNFMGVYKVFENHLDKLAMVLELAFGHCQVNEKFSECRDKLTYISNTFHWLKSEFVCKLDSNRNLLPSIFALEILKKLEAGERETISRYAPECYNSQQVINMLPKILFENTTAEQKAQLPLIFCNKQNMILSYIKLVQKSKNFDLLKEVYKTCVSNSQKIYSVFPGMFGKIIEKIDREGLPHLIKAIRELNYSEKKANAFYRVLLNGMYNKERTESCITELEPDVVEKIMKEEGIDTSKDNVIIFDYFLEITKSVPAN